MFNQNFYHQTIRRAVAVFGSIFNEINIVRRDGSGKSLNSLKVPLAYGPKQKFLARINQQTDFNNTKIAIKLPRLSFELTSLDYNPDSKLQKNNWTRLETNSGARMIGPVDYNLGFQLSIMAKNQDDALQILEQILPYFQPDYSVTVKQVDDSERNDMAITLTGVSLTDDYEGDFSTRKALIYTLDFQTRIRFYGPVLQNEVIKRVLINQNSVEGDEFFTGISLMVNPLSSSKAEPHEIEVKNFGNLSESVILTLNNTNGLSENDLIIGSDSATVGRITSIDGQSVTVTEQDGFFNQGELLLSGNMINSVDEVWE